LKSRFVIFLAALIASALASSVVRALAPEVWNSTSAIPPHIAGRFRDARGFEQSDFGQYYVFDRRGHRVYGIDEAQERVWEIVQLGPEEGRIIDPTGFSVAPNGTFVVADMPDGNERIQVFTPVGFRTGGFVLPRRDRPHITFNDVVLSGIGSLQYTGSSILISQPEVGSLVTEYALSGQTIRTFGQLRPTGHEDDRDVHAALNSGIPLKAPDGSVFFVFQAGLPVFRKFDSAGTLMFERHVEGQEIDETIARLPTTWMRRTATSELPLVVPTVRTAAVDREGRLWISFVTPPYTYVYDSDGDKVRTVQLRGAGLISPSSLFFGSKGRLLVTPGLVEFDLQSRR
jgi:hypothetical protein